MAEAIVVVEALRQAQLDRCRELFAEYQRGLGVSLCFQGFEQELLSLPGQYAPPRGRLYLAQAGTRPVGCVALRPLAGDACEMKRLYVREEARGRGLGRSLAERIVADARAIGYRTLKLDTLPRMVGAQALYEALGFEDTAPYNDNPVEGVRFMALDLARGAVTS